MFNLELNNTVLTILREFISEVLDQEHKLDAMVQEHSTLLQKI